MHKSRSAVRLVGTLVVTALIATVAVVAALGLEPLEGLSPGKTSTSSRRTR